jgi:hypothetical protein
MLKFENCGIAEKIEGLDIEILSHNFHNPNCDIVCAYYMEGLIKVELTYFKSLDGEDSGHEVYFFKGDSNEHYYSNSYMEENIPTKYKSLAKKLIEIHDKIDFDKYTK